MCPIISNGPSVKSIHIAPFKNRTSKTKKYNCKVWDLSELAPYQFSISYFLECIVTFRNGPQLLATRICTGRGIGTLVKATVS